MSLEEHEARVVQPAHQINQMDVRQVRDVAGITYLEEGDPAATPIVFLHGIGGGARAFVAQLAHFGRRYRAIAWNMPGYAGTAPLPLVTMEAMAAALAGFMRALRLERPVLVGHSFGGMVVQRLLMEAPNAARAVVLAQTRAASAPDDPAAKEAFIRARLEELDAGKSMAEIAPGSVSKLVGAGADPAGVALAIELRGQVPHSTFRDVVLAMPGFDGRLALGQIAVPTLLLAGSRDRIASPAEMQAMAESVPRARYTVLEGAGHLAHLEQPARFNAAVEAFLCEALTQATEKPA